MAQVICSYLSVDCYWVCYYFWSDTTTSMLTVVFTCFGRELLALRQEAKVFMGQMPLQSLCQQCQRRPEGNSNHWPRPVTNQPLARASFLDPSCISLLMEAALLSLCCLSGATAQQWHFQRKCCRDLCSIIRLHHRRSVNVAYWCGWSIGVCLCLSLLATIVKRLKVEMVFGVWSLGAQGTAY